MHKINDGEININGRLAYVPQQAWIQNATLKDNILFGKPFCKDTYNEIIHSCSLQADIDTMPAGKQAQRLLIDKFDFNVFIT